MKLPGRSCSTIRRRQPPSFVVEQAGASLAKSTAPGVAPAAMAVAARSRRDLGSPCQQARRLNCWSSLSAREDGISMVPDERWMQMRTMIRPRHSGEIGSTVRRLHRRRRDVRC